MSEQPFRPPTGLGAAGILLGPGCAVLLVNHLLVVFGDAVYTKLVLLGFMLILTGVIPCVWPDYLEVVEGRAEAPRWQRVVAIALLIAVVAAAFLTGDAFTRHVYGVSIF